ncbi:MAG TPA: NIL domain-containing protein [Candidatus Nitrosotalea sp.]|nr:NIL domain-containing protein [Candidatus Nitrosotalea sp.]
MRTTTRLRVRLTFPAELVQKPLIYHLVKDFDLVTNIRRAEVRSDHGWCVLELEGPEEQLEQGVAWLERQGVAVNPIARDVVLP